MPVEEGEAELVDAGFAVRANNDHGISPDGRTLIISDGTEEGVSLIYTLPIEGGEPRRVTEHGPSYWHGVSPDGRTLVYTGLRNDDYDIYAISAEGGEETRLTTAPGLTTGRIIRRMGGTSTSIRCAPAPCRYTAWMQPAAMWKPSPRILITTGFPTRRPDGQWIAFLSYEPDVEGHPPNKDVMLRIIPAEGGEPRVLAHLFGGQGTINVPSWAPDSKRFAFVSYRLEE